MEETGVHPMICEKCGKKTEKAYGMTNGEFWCEECASPIIPKTVLPVIDSEWKSKTFAFGMVTNINELAVKSDALINEFLESLGSLKDVKITASLSGAYYIVTILYLRGDNNVQTTNE